MALTTYNCDKLTGGGTRALDSISQADLVDGCRALCVIDGVFMPFLYDASRSDAQTVAVHPFIVRPYDYSSAGVWVEQWTGAPGENLLINGDFSVWQRGTSFSPLANLDYIADRWQMSFTGGAPTASKVTLSDSERVTTGAQYCLEVDQPVGGTGLQLLQKIETSSAVMEGRYIAVSFWAQADSPFTLNYVQIRRDTPTLWNTISIGTEWQKYTGIIGPITNTSHGVPYVGIRFPDGTSPACRLANFKLEYGQTVTPFVPRQPAEELALCQRYYWRGKFINGSGYKYGVAAISMAPVAYGTFPVQMRTSPTLAIVTAPTYYNCTHNSLAGNEYGMTHRVNVTADGPFRAYEGVYEADAEI